MPALVAKHQEKVTVTKLKKAYSVLSQAFVQAIDEYGPIADWGYNEADGNNTLSSGNKILDNLAPYLNLAKKCTYQENGANCLPRPNNNNKLLNGTGWNVAGKPTAMLADGTVFFIYPDNASGSGWIGIITNDKPPVQAGINTFLIRYSGGKFLPFGGRDDGGESFEAGCRDKTTHTGWGCAAWVLYNENLDYLHCDDLSWNGKHKCD